MAQVSLSVLLVLLLCGVAGPVGAAEATPERWAHALLWSLNQRQFALVDSLLTAEARFDDGYYRQPERPGPADRLTLGFYLNALWRAQPGLRWELVRAFGGGDQVVVEWKVYTAAGPAAGVPGVYRLEVTDRGIRSWTAYYTSAPWAWRGTAKPVGLREGP